jgi:hypothetical protein
MSLIKSSVHQKKGRMALAIAACLFLWAKPSMGQVYNDQWISWQDAQFTINLPKDWVVVEQSGLGERDLVAMPQPPNLERLYSTDGQETLAVIIVRAHQLDFDSLILPLRVLAEDEITGWQLFMTRYNLPFEILDQFDYQINGNTGICVVTLRSDMLDRTFFFLEGEYLFTVRIAVRYDMQSSFEGFFQKVMEGFDIKYHSEEEMSTEKYITSVGEIILPAGWHLSEYDSYPQVLITKEKMTDGNSGYTIGVSILRLDGLKAPNPDQLYQSWSYSYLGYYNPSIMRLLNTDLIAVDGQMSLFLEVSYWREEKGDYYQAINVSSVKGGSFYNITFEAPVKEFVSLRPIFLQTLSALKLK